jgi:hypothetical protein
VPSFGAAGTTGIALLFGGLVRGEGGALDPEVAEAAATCVMTPAKTEGPYFVDERLNRSDIRSDTASGQHLRHRRRVAAAGADLGRQQRLRR